MNYYQVSTRQLTEVTAALAEPVTLAKIKTFLNLSTADDDTLLDALIKAARDHVEMVLQRALVRRTYRADIGGFYRAIRLPWAPLASVTSVKYYDTASPSVLTTLADSSISPETTSEVYRVNEAGSMLYLVNGEAWPTADLRHDAVQITYVAGYAPDSASPLDHAANVPDAIKSALKLLIGDMYLNREAQSMMKLDENRTFKSLLASYREF